jgi:hypothetical protein
MNKIGLEVTCYMHTLSEDMCETDNSVCNPVVPTPNLQYNVQS